MSPQARPLVSAGTVLGMGLGGFFDGIVFHQLLQIHGMLSARVPKSTIANLEINMFWDGVFHAATWLLTVLGVVMLFRVGERRDVWWSRRVLTGSLAMGWGIFNLVEGAIDHHLLELHHVVERIGSSAWDWAFLGSGVALIGFGWTRIRSGDARAAATGPLRHAPAHR